ncbi:cobalamin biosynthesis protein [Micromonospora sp. WMMD1102]|uniref:cobalamin biosynthesis protein n=1 Tax=Micromonospora sp. WMMD1102 TaxID=3016105 RepID=UPI0024155798|nr:cobalamin biosynthesis protein [Micromonospora sp. WMMD1102]MDG4789423.1 cobalamin biosynthesis protein [Micromonospora sp. WMMD1102]
MSGNSRYRQQRQERQQRQRRQQRQHQPRRQYGGAANAAGLVAGYALDAIFGDPRRWHPVAGFGQFATALERRTYQPRRTSGAGFAALAVGVPVVLGGVAAVATRQRPLARTALVAAATWTVLGGRTLRREATVMSQALRRADLPAARLRLGHLCGRDPATLDEPELARATVESVAENTSDAVVAPLVWGAVAGLPGLLGYRAANTLDAMVGHRSERYARFGTAAARLDDLLNLLPSRLTGLLTIVAAPLVRGDRTRAWQVWRRDRADHPSPNAGQCEAAMAGALGVRLGGRNVYFGRSEVRPFLGDGPRPEARHIDRAARLSGAVGLAALALTAAYAATSRARRATTGWLVRGRLPFPLSLPLPLPVRESTSPAEAMRR